MIEINLLPEHLRPRAQTPATKKPPALAPVPKAFSIALIGITLLMGLLIFVSGSRVGASQRKVGRIEHELDQIKKQAAEAEQVTLSFPATEARYKILADRLDGKTPWAELLRVVSLRCPERVMITSVKVERDRRTNRPIKLVVSGAYEDTGSLEMAFASGLKGSATFSAVFESVIPERSLEPDGRTSFSLFCAFRPRADELLDATEEVPSP